MSMITTDTRGETVAQMSTPYWNFNNSCIEFFYRFNGNGETILSVVTVTEVCISLFIYHLLK